jgi:hypothetical protein
MDATDQANLLSSITLMKALKELVICVSPPPHHTPIGSPNQSPGEGRALFSPQHPLGHAYDVVVSKTRSYGSVVDEYEARLVLYMGKPPAVVYSESVALLVNPCRCESPVDAMVDLLEGLYECAGR